MPAAQPVAAPFSARRRRKPAPVAATRPSALAAAGLALLLALPLATGTAWAQLPDADGDGHIDTIETFLDSDPGQPASTPESIALPETCFDELDNDLDGDVDAADGGCTPPEVSDQVFPLAGLDVFSTDLTLEGYGFSTPQGVCPLDFEGTGATVVLRSDPLDVGSGLREIEVELVAMQLTGTATILVDPGCALPPISFPATLIEDPAQASSGGITDINADPDRDYPADSFFDIFFGVDTPFGLLPGGPPGGPPGQPVRVTNTIRSIPPYYSPGNADSNPDCYRVPGLPHLHCPVPPLDNFKCYSVFPEPVRIELEDQFERESASFTRRVPKPFRFCNPVSKNDEPIFDDNAHLKCYSLKFKRESGGFPPEVRVRNQFGAQTLRLIRPQALCLPAQKNLKPKPRALDHFKCYQADGAAINRTVTLVDQFHEERVTVRKPVRLCNPVEKTIAAGGHRRVTEIGNRDGHLVCYDITPKTAIRRRLLVEDQFGPEALRTVLPRELCVHSTKQLVDGGRCGDGVIDPGEQCDPAAVPSGCPHGAACVDCICLMEVP